jgi:TolA-binding protein
MSRIVALIGIAAVAVTMLTGSAAAASCQGSDYAAALCLYRTERYQEAEAIFSKIVRAGAEQPETIKAHYFLARSEMKLQRWDEASVELMKIFALAPEFYNEWNCDFLLGVCREKLGKG